MVKKKTRKSGLLTKAAIRREIAKARADPTTPKSDIRTLLRIKKLSTKFQLSKPIRRTSRSKITRRLQNSTILTDKAKESVKIFKIKDSKSGRVLFIPAVPKGITIRKRRSK